MLILIHKKAILRPFICCRSSAKIEDLPTQYPNALTRVTNWASVTLLIHITILCIRAYNSPHNTLSENKFTMGMRSVTDA